MKLAIKHLALLMGTLFSLGCSHLDQDPYSVPGNVLPYSCEQVIVGVADDWDTSRATLYFLERKRNGEWIQVGDSWSARLGSAGLVWGLGESPVPKDEKIKTEGDKRTPAGIFDLDHKIFAYDEKTPVGKGFTVRKVTPYDLWIEDPKSPLYNHHLVLDHLPQGSWETGQQMKQNDPAHKIKLFIHHNSPSDENRPVPGAGSSIFFHIWRDGGLRATAGCTAMSEQNIMRMLRLLDASKNPMYVILPREEYKRYQEEWHLPDVL